MVVRGEEVMEIESEHEQSIDTTGSISSRFSCQKTGSQSGPDDGRNLSTDKEQTSSTNELTKNSNTAPADSFYNFRKFPFPILEVETMSDLGQACTKIGMKDLFMTCMKSC